MQVAGSGPPCPLRSWEELGSRYKVGQRLRDALAAAGWQDPTPIQRQAVPILLEGEQLPEKGLRSKSGVHSVL